MGRNVHSVMLSVQHFLCRQQHRPPSKVLGTDRLTWCRLKTTTTTLVSEDGTVIILLSARRGIFTKLAPFFSEDGIMLWFAASQRRLLRPALLAADAAETCVHVFIYVRNAVTHAKFHWLGFVWPPKGGRGCLMSPPCLESQGCHLIPLCYLLSCSSV